eukprot:CAMPEP_0206544226 /NCGR_PEP_ID=MMETSP0325_2-20121206/11390_1 /ASSEMBLY_ACC=CAM_ASM_000347 /TAXON_ID=2866 /ORGANISM="Crypthecodinium cohnii, Strain Seligo" /LENGTH=135 /DNA_ID=CAMNT_0054042931 /DNA_START=681 /DNA_END=1088 /DNA_ORIENTATION=-
MSMMWLTSVGALTLPHALSVSLRSRRAAAEIVRPSPPVEESADLLNGCNLRRPTETRKHIMLRRRAFHSTAESGIGSSHFFKLKRMQVLIALLILLKHAPCLKRWAILIKSPAYFAPQLPYCDCLLMGGKPMNLV